MGGFLIMKNLNYFNGIVDILTTLSTKKRLYMYRNYIVHWQTQKKCNAVVLLKGEKSGLKVLFYAHLNQLVGQAF